MVFFWPLDFTFVCPSEIIAYSNRVEKLAGINTKVVGISIDGGFAEFVTVPAQIARVVPAGLDDRIAAMIEPFGIAVHACMSQRGVAGRTVLVNGCGPIGLMTVAAARALGARRVLAADPNPLRLTMTQHPA